MATAISEFDPAIVAREKSTLESTILQRIAERDQTAIDECLDSYGGLVWSICRQYCSSVSDAEDAVQEIFVEIWQSADRFDPERSAEPTFISVIARRRLIDRYRKQTRIPEVVSYDQQAIDIPVSSDDHAEVADEARKAAKCFGKLNDRQREILGLSIHQGRAHGWIAKALKMPLGSVKSYARRGLIQLKDCMNRNHALQTDGGAA